MAQFTEAQLQQAARAMAAMPRTRNPALTPGAIEQVDRRARGLAVAVCNHPTYSAVARGESVDGPSMNPSSRGPVRGSGFDARNPTERWQLLGFTSVSIGTGATSGVTATPYAPFRGRRIVLAPYTIGVGSPGTVDTIQVGNKPQFAALNKEPLEMFAAGLQAGYVELDEAYPAIGISMNVSLTATATVYGAVVGITRRNRNANRPEGARRKLMRLPMTPQAGLAAAGTANYTITPTLRFWGRKIVLGEQDQLSTTIMGLTYTGATGAAGQNTTGLFVGPASQLANLPTASAPVPSATFNLNYDIWLDLDMAETAVPYTFQQTCIGTVSSFFGGVIEGDCDLADLATT